jgi:hypothetical protein
MGPSGVGKTFSALRLGSGMRDVVGGKLHVIDTENGRALHYADIFDFQHVPFSPPFSPDDYLAALQHCVADGASTIVVDSQSHEHEGLGGVLEWHEHEMDRLYGDAVEKAQRFGNKEPNRDGYKFSAWIAPKSARQRLINGILQLRANVIFCFRAKEKLKVIPGKQPEPLGWMPIAGDEFLYEMTTCALLMPGANGVPTWNPKEQGERAMIKRPRQFEGLLRRFEGKQLCEEMGAEMAKWAMGDAVPSPAPANTEAPKLTKQEIARKAHEDVLALIAQSTTHEELDKRIKTAHDWHAKKFWSADTLAGTLATIEAKRATLAEGA